MIELSRPERYRAGITSPYPCSYKTCPEKGLPFILLATSAGGGTDRELNTRLTSPGFCVTLPIEGVKD